MNYLIEQARLQATYDEIKLQTELKKLEVEKLKVEVDILKTVSKSIENGRLTGVCEVVSGLLSDKPFKWKDIPIRCAEWQLCAKEECRKSEEERDSPKSYANI